MFASASKKEKHVKIFFIGHTFLQVIRLFMIIRICTEGLFHIYANFTVLPYDGCYQNYYRNGETILFKTYISAKIHAWKHMKQCV